MTAETTQFNSPENLADLAWRYWFTVPIYPYRRRRTIRKEVLTDKIWTFDQIQGIFYVVVPIRMTAIKLDRGGLLIYAPVAPTPECLRLLQEIIDLHGEIKYIVLPTISGVEHKTFVGPFARNFPSATVLVAPNQWSFPLNLPLSWLGLPAKRTQILPLDSSQAPTAEEFDYAILGPVDLKSGWFEEVVFLHRSSGTLLVTDTIVAISEDPPAIVSDDPYPLLFHAKDDAAEAIVDTAANRRKGWQRICLFALYFRSSVLNPPQWSKVFRDVFRASDRSVKAFFGIFPFQWQPHWQYCFKNLWGGGRLFVAPILQTLILNRSPKTVLEWADKVASWNFQRIVPCHFDSPITATPQEFRRAFNFLEEGNEASNSIDLPQDDFQLLQQIDAYLTKIKIIPPPLGRNRPN
jgi:hypothetical protein